ncbi:MAG: high-potential iron-sulfur protein [Dokdonella sp.]
MSHPANLEGRRRFLKAAVVGAIAAPVAGILLPKLARAQDLPHLEESDATASALGYKHDASLVDKAKYPQYQAGRACVNCNFFQTKAGAAWGPCQLFPGKAVDAKGWCAGYAVET